MRRVDQDKINKFSRLHQREIVIEEELKTKNVRPLRILAVVEALELMRLRR